VYNIITIICDSLRQDHLGCYGNKWIDTPNIDKLAAESVVFENAYPEGLPTLPVRSALFTGNFTLTNRFWQPLTPQDVTMSEILDEYDYTSALITDCYHMFKPNMNFHRGFHVWRFIRGQEADAYRSKPHSKDLNQYIKPELLGTRFIRNLDQYFRNTAGREKEDDYSAAKVVTEAITWLEDNHKNRQPFFLHVDCFDPHEPWDPPPPFDTKYADSNYRGPKLIQPLVGPVDWMTEEELAYTRALYAGEVSFVDKWIGRLLDRIRNMGLMENSIILFLSDHGISIGDHGIMLKTTDHLYNEVLRIPLLIRLPNGEYSGKRIKELACIVDILPTVLDVIGKGNESEYMHGKSLLPLIRGDISAIRQYVTMGFFSSDDRCIRNEQWSYIRRSGNRENELYHLGNDPDEIRNLANEFPETIEEMNSAIAKIFNCRTQKESWFQLKFDIPGMCEDRFPQPLVWKK